MYITASISVNLSKLKKFKAAVNDQLNGAYGPVNSAIKLWAVRYRSFIQQRFDIYSKGGGDWKPLAESTIKQRRRGTKSNAAKLREIYSAKVQFHKKDSQAVSAGGQISILRDTGLLFNALAPVFIGAPGAIEHRIKFGIRVGYGGPQKHAVGNKQGKATIADIASFHQNGFMPRLPKRELIVEPSVYLIKQMEDDMQKALDDLWYNV